MDGFIFKPTNMLLISPQHAVSNEVCGFDFHVFHAVTDEIKASLRMIWSDSQISSLVSLRKKVKEEREGRNERNQGLSAVHCCFSLSLPGFISLTFLFIR